MKKTLIIITSILLFSCHNNKFKVTRVDKIDTTIINQENKELVIDLPEEFPLVQKGDELIVYDIIYDSTDKKIIKLEFKH